MDSSRRSVAQRSRRVAALFAGGTPPQDLGHSVSLHYGTLEVVLGSPWVESHREPDERPTPAAEKALRNAVAVHTDFSCLHVGHHVPQGRQQGLRAAMVHDCGRPRK